MLSTELRKGLDSLEAELRQHDERRVLLFKAVEAMKMLLDHEKPSVSVEPIPRRAKRKRIAPAKASRRGKPGGRNARYDWTLGREMWDADKTVEQIAEALGSSESAVKQAKHRYKWPRRTVRGRPKKEKTSAKAPQPASARKGRKKISLTKCPCGAFTSTDPCETCHTKIPTGLIGKLI